MNYLQYLEMKEKNAPFLRFLVSGADLKIHQLVAERIINASFSKQAALLIVDQTKSGSFLNGFAEYRVIDALSGEIRLCGDLLEVDSMEKISRLRTILMDLGFSSIKAMQIITFLQFIRETENRLGHKELLTIQVLEQYAGIKPVKWKLEQLLHKGTIDQEDYEYLISRYLEISGASADFENFLILLSPFLGKKRPIFPMAIHFPFGAYFADQTMQNLMGRFLVSYIKQTSHVVLLIFDDGSDTERSAIMNILKDVPSETEVHMFSRDVFSLGEADRNVLMNEFQVKIYTRHEEMTSCLKLETHCGDMDVVKRASTVSIDRRIRANSVWDMLFQTNRTETEIHNAPVKEPRFRKERIHSLPQSCGILECKGEKVMWNF